VPPDRRDPFTALSLIRPTTEQQNGVPAGVDDTDKENAVMKQLRFVLALVAAGSIVAIDMKPVFAQATGAEQERPVVAQERPVRPERPARPGRPERRDRRDRPERPERRDRPERPERPDRPERPERPERPDRPERPERPERPARSS
jgi:hypothetical protein